MTSASHQKLTAAGFDDDETEMLISVFDSVSAAYDDNRIDDVIVDALCTMASAGSRAPEKLAAYAEHRARYAMVTIPERVIGGS